MSSAGVSLDLVRELRAISGDQYVTETSSSGVISVSPASADEVAAILRLANQRGFAVTPVGGGTQFNPAQAQSEVLLHTGRLTEVEHYDPADLTVGIGAGMTVAQLSALVNPNHLMFACDPPLPERSTVGGILATNSHGPMRHGYGALRDFCIGIRFITGDSRKAKGGGRVVKNVAGYDLMKLLIGSHGTLAVITSASFKLFPTPRQTRTFIAEFATWQDALKFSDVTLRSPLAPMCLELVSPRARKLMRPETTEDAWVICVRGAGSDAVLARYRKELGSAVVKEVDGPEETRLWLALSNFPLTAEDESLLDVVPGLFAPLDLMAPPAELARLLQALDSMLRSQQTGIEGGFIGRIGIGHLRVHAWPLPDAIWSGPGYFGEEITKLHPEVNVIGRSIANPWIVESANFAQMRCVKRALDPNDVLRGRKLF